MSDPNAWPQLTWDALATVPALAERIRDVAARARRFEAALELAGENDEADLAMLDEELAEWDRHADVVFVHTALGEGKPIAPADVPARARELEKAYAELRDRRSAMLDKLGPAAARVLAREHEVKVDEALLRVGEGTFGPCEDADESEEREEAFFQDVPAEKLRHLPEEDDEEPDIEERARAGEAPRMLGDEMDVEPTESTVSKLSGERPATAMESRAASPITAEEYRLRQHAEAKPCPKVPHVEALLEILPIDWVLEVWRTLRLPCDDPKASGQTRVAGMRLQIREHLRSREGLAAAVRALADEDRELLAEVVTKGSLRYSKMAPKWGSDESDGYYWDRRVPSGPLARLRRSGLAYVCVRDGHRVVVAPADLAEGLRRVLAIG